jgi:hypothetical protein
MDSERHNRNPLARDDESPHFAISKTRLISKQSGYRNRALPIPLKHRQPSPHLGSGNPSLWATEPIWTQLLPLTKTRQYLIHWYVCETLPPSVEEAMTSDPKSPYQSPPLFDCLTLDERLAEEPNGYEPKWHAGTTVNDGLENFYE